MDQLLLGMIGTCDVIQDFAWYIFSSIRRPGMKNKNWNDM